MESAKAVSPASGGERSVAGAARGDRHETEVVPLIQAVHRLVRHRAYDSITVAEILGETGLGTRAFYRHFSSKDDLLVAMFEHETELVVAQLTESLESESRASARFDRWADWYLSLLSSPRRMTRFVVLQHEHDRLTRDHRDRMVRLDHQRDGVLVGILELGLQDGSFPSADPQRDAPVIHSLMTGLLRRAATEQDQTPDEVRRRLMRFCGPVLTGPSGDGVSGRREL